MVRHRSSFGGGPPRLPTIGNCFLRLNSNVSSVIVTPIEKALGKTWPKAGGRRAGNKN